MKPIQNQLSLFDYPIVDYDQVLTDKANKLVDLLNDGRKEKYHQKSYTQIGDYIVLVVENKHKDLLFNVLDHKGNTPPSMPVNWRNAQLVKQDLNEQLLN